MARYTYKNFLEYLRDNPKGYWFKRKLYGYGWTPATWQGFLVTLIFILGLVLDGVWFASLEKPLVRDFVIFYSILFVLIIFLIFIAYKMGEKPSWSWGR